MNLLVHHKKESQTKKKPDLNKNGLYEDHIANRDCKLEKKKNVSI